MHWKKLGQLFCSENKYPWMFSHSSNPVADLLNGDVFRIYFTSRDKKNRSFIGYVDIDILTLKILNISEEPVLSPGEPGMFDDSGVSLSSIVKVSEKKFMYYLGWNLGVTVPWRNSIGLAVYNEEKRKFEKYSKAPIVDRHHVDPFSLSYPFVLKDNNIYKMWYGSNLRWGENQSDMDHVIKYAESTDGINWKREGLIAINSKNNTEYAFSRPSVIKENGKYKMWYSYRGSVYRMGYAESINGIEWVRKDEEAGISVSNKGWDSEMICYPFVFDHKGKRYMLYSGNEYGKSGFGLAILENE